MKFTRSTWISLFVILFLVAAVVFYLMYNSASKDHKLAQNNLNAARLSQTALNKTKSDLSAQMAQAVADVAAWNNKITLLQTSLGQASLSLKQTQSKFPTSAQTIEYNETLMGLAKSCNLTMSTVVSTEPVLGDIGSGDFTFYANVFTINVSGQVSDILNFVDKVATNSVFTTGAITPVSFTIPPPMQPSPPLSQAVKDQMRTDIKNQMIAGKNASIKGEDRIALIEQSFLELLGENSTGPTVTQMTQAIQSIIAAQISTAAANLLAGEIAQAIENNLADMLVDRLATVYSDAISPFFVDQTAGLLPIISGPLGTEITAAIQDIPGNTIPGTIKTVIANKLNSMVSDKIAAMVSDSSVDEALNAAIAAELAVRVAAAQAAQQMPSAQLTVAVYSYKGD